MILSYVINRLWYYPYKKYNYVKRRVLLPTYSVHRRLCLVSAAEVGKRTNLVLIVTQAQ